MRKINFRKALAVLFLIFFYSPSLIYAHYGSEGLDDSLGGMGEGMTSLTGNAILDQVEGASKYDSVIIYYNEACSMCSDYIKQEFVPALERLGVKNIVKKDYVSEPQHRVELNELNKKYQIPSTLQGHFVALVGTEEEPHKIILGGHVPLPVVVDLLTKGEKDGEEYRFEHLLVLQDEMEDAKSYFTWGFKGDAKEYPIDAPISDYLSWFNANQAQLPSPAGAYEKSWSFSTLLPLIIATGFLDGINPCAFAVLLLFIAFFIYFTQNQNQRVENGLSVYFSHLFSLFPHWLRADKSIFVHWLSTLDS